MTDLIILNDRYQLETTLGTGGMAVVYRARDLMLERTVAIKVLRPRLSRDPQFRERFRHEAKAAANLSHPNIVTVHDFGLDSGKLFIVMEYVPGADLKTMLKQQGRFHINQAVNLTIQSCSGIGYAHRSGVVHCDVKPQNMLVTPDQRLKVVDFGIARLLATISPEEQHDVVWGSPLYFSPEQAAGIAPSPASDVYSLGIILYEMLTGQLPFNAQTPEDLARMHRENTPHPPSELNPNIPPTLEQILLKVLSKEPAARYRTADQFGRVLKNYNLSHPSRHPNQAGIPMAASAATIATRGQPAPEPVLPAPAPTPVQNSYATVDWDEAEASSPGSKSQTQDFDWQTWLLALIVLITVVGLIPFWLWVFYILYPPL